MICAVFVLMLIGINSRGIDTSVIDRQLTGDAYEVMKGQKSGAFDAEKAFSSIKDKAFTAIANEVKKSASGSVTIFSICAICSLASALGRKESISENTVETTSVCAVSAICFGTAATVLSSCASSVDGLSSMTAALLPVYAAAMAISGKPISAVSLHSAAVLCSSAVVYVSRRFVLPMIYLYIIASAAGLVSRSVLLEKSSELFYKMTVWCFRGVLMIYTFFISVTGVVTSSADAAAVKTSKAAISGAVPVLGSILSDASDALISGAAALKASVGAFGAVSAAAICLSPFIAALVKMTAYKILSVFALSFSGNRTSKLLDAVSKGFSLAVGTLGTCCAVLFISLAAGAIAV